MNVYAIYFALVREWGEAMWTDMDGFTAEFARRAPGFRILEASPRTVFLSRA